MEFTDIILTHLRELSLFDIMRIKTSVDSILGNDAMATVAGEIKGTKGLLSAVKYVKEMTGWSLIDSKKYCDAIPTAKV